MDITTLSPGLITIVLVVLIVLPYYIVHRRRERAVEKTFNKALEAGAEEPDTLHPVIDPNACLCTGNCVAACPEQDVLGLLNGAALAIQPDKCVGHGLCERVCPMDAIQLVVGTATRGVDIPRIQENFETNVPGLFVVGELGGMGLIRNAFEQAGQCIEGIAAKATPHEDSSILDVLIVGCGPAGLAASLHAKEKGMRFLTIEKEDIGGTVRYYPRKKMVMTAPVHAPGYGKIKARSIVKEDLIQLWDGIVEKTNLRPSIHTREAFLNAERNPAGYFDITTDKGAYKAAHLILAIGRRGTPRKLGIEGEEQSHVAYSLIEPEHYQNNIIMVVGGGDSAVECALALSEQPGNVVRLSYRKDKFTRVKQGNRELLEQAIASHRIEFLPSTTLQSIAQDQVHYLDLDGKELTIANDYIFVMIGGTLPNGILKELGIKIDTKFGEPLAG